MVNHITATVKVDMTESEDAKHRYILYKEWDKAKPTCTIITLYPGAAELVITDTTQMLITNHLYRLGYGAFYSVNLFSKIGIANRGKKAFVGATNKANDEFILECVEKSNSVIFAWGSLPDKNQVVKHRVEAVLSKLSTYSGECFRLTDNYGEKECHPLSPKLRHSWNLIPITNIT
jgi:hypothetical protein